MPELETLPQGERVMFVLMQALDALRDGLRPFVVTVLEQKEGPRWFEHPRVQRMVSVPASLQGEAPWGAEGPAFDLALLLKLIGSDCYWYRSFRPRLPGISRWQIDSLRELRNRVAHNDGSDPLLTSAAGCPTQVRDPFCCNGSHGIGWAGSHESVGLRNQTNPSWHPMPGSMVS